MIEKSFNRIILIGNGFDRALGLKTSYADFVLFLYKYMLIRIFEKTNFETELFSGNIDFTKHNEKDLKSRKKEINALENVDGAKNYCTELVKITHKTNLFESITKSLIDKRWVDIEKEYYDELLKTLRGYKNIIIRAGNRDESIIKLNKSMSKIKKELDEYISKINSSRNVNYFDSGMISLIELCFGAMSEVRTKEIDRHNRSNSPSEVLFLNFNYTDTVKKFLENNGGINWQHIFIHGRAKNESSPIIFGYGDDTGEEYKELESIGENKFLENIKSFHYQTRDYHKLLNFLSYDDFDVYIVGHSCGLSDRTLLKTIFEHKNCLALRIFHYKDKKDGKKEDFEKRIEISRHFSNKALFRERVFSYQESDKIPQVTA